MTFPAGLGINTDVLGWGAIFADVDNDGWPDLLLVNGHVYPEVDSAHLGAAYRERRLLYYNLGNGKFRDISKDSGPGLQTPMSGRGLAIADLWNDGRLEEVVNNLSDLPLLLVNVAKNNNHWLGLKLTGTRSNRDAIGARVTLRGEHRLWVDEVRSGSSYISNNDMRVHFGLGTATKIDSVTVRWPNGRMETFEGLSVDAIHTLKEGDGAAARSDPKNSR